MFYRPGPRYGVFTPLTRFSVPLTEIEGDFPSIGGPEQRGLICVVEER